MHFSKFHRIATDCCSAIEETKLI